MFNSQIIEKFKNLPTPFYYYDLGLLEENLQTLDKISSSFGYKVHYALKANANDRILKLICSYGLGADCVSGNEVKKALDMGFPKNKIVFAGVGKTDEEINLALENEIQCINIESIQEMEVINNLAEKFDRIVPIALRINPDLDAHTHHYITTGLEENKFGIYQHDLDGALDNLSSLKYLQLIGLHFHIGSQISDLNVFKNLCLKVNEIQGRVETRGIKLEHLNLGGGLGVDYQNPDNNLISDFHNYFEIIHNYLKPLENQSVHFELGRSIVAQCGSLISRVLYVKKGIQTRFAVLDAGMTELIRPALYSAFHKIENLTGAGENQKYDIVGPVCETADFFGKGVELPEVERGDLIAIRTTGAYGQVMASHYNLRDFANVVYSDFKE